MKLSIFIVTTGTALICAIVPAHAATCGDGGIGDGICPQQGFCCSEWGWCGSSNQFCNGPTSTPAPFSSPTILSPVARPTAGVNDINRMIAYLGNWQGCPTVDQLEQYTHIVVAFAVSYSWAQGGNQCSATCEIATPSICNNNANPALLSELKAKGKKIIISFGGAGMGGSWDSSVDDCWEYCYGREDQVVKRMIDIVSELDADGVDLDYEYYYENGQNGSGFNKGDQAISFLRQVTVGLRNSLPADAIVTHAPMDIDVQPGSAYYALLRDISHTLDFLMPQYYNGITRPALDGIDGAGVGSVSALDHYSTITEDLFGGDGTRMVFGFCISDCGATSSNANGAQAASVMTDLIAAYGCNGGAFFWVAEHDGNGAWSSVVNGAMKASSTCTAIVPTNPSPVATNPTTLAPVFVPVTPISAPTSMPSSEPIVPPTVPTTVSAGPCCPTGHTGLRPVSDCTQFYHCVNGTIVGVPIACGGGTLFDVSIGTCNWAAQVTCSSSEQGC